MSKGEIWAMGDKGIIQNLKSTHVESKGGADVWPF